MNKTVHRADTRGYADHGWLKTNHTFSFASYMNPERMGFGKLRVLNDDIVEGGMGFGTHPHNNMEIISIPIYGSMRHKDSTGHEGVISGNEVQVMSAGSGVYHSEYNGSDSEDMNFLQIWIMPKEMNIEPHYDQKSFDPAGQENRFQTVAGPNTGNGSLWINQDAFVSLANISEGEEIDYEIQHEGNGVYAFVIEGSINAAGETLGRRDAIGLSGTKSVSFKANEDARILAIEVPMN